MVTKFQRPKSSTSNTSSDFFIAIPIDTIISGGAKGADTLARNYAKEMGLNLVEYKAQWKVYGKAAGIRRNWDIVTASDIILAFWDGQSKGTASSLSYTRQQKKPCVIIYF